MTVPRHLAFDAVGAKHSGAATVLQALVVAAMRSADVRRVTVFCSPAAHRGFELPANDRLDVVDAPLGERGPAGRLAWQYLRLPAMARRLGADVLLGLSGGGVAPRGTPGVLLIQQSLPFCEEAMATLSAGQRIRARALGWNMRIAAKRSAAVAVQTPTMARWVSQIYRLDPARVRLFEPCATAEAPTREAPELAAMRQSDNVARFLYVGNSSAYKNLGVLAGAMKHLRERCVAAQLFATVPQGHPVLAAPGVEALGPMSRPVLSEAYRLATALVMPSLVETVGLPMLEAFQAGTPVVAADRPYAHDVCGDAALYFDPYSAGALADRLEHIASDPTSRERLSVLGLGVARARSDAKPYDAMVAWLVGLAGETRA